MGRKICLVTGFQSNERGSAVTGSGASMKLHSLYGFPIETPGGKSGVFDVLAQMLGAAGHAVWVRNMAWGGAGALASWNGYVRTWQANSVGFAPGSWCLPTVPNNRKYLAGGTPGVSQSTGSSEPSWTTTIDATVADGTITWTCKAADSKDVAGYVYQQGDSGYDPRGYISDLLNAVADAKNRGFEVWTLLAGHQSDYGNPASTVAAVVASLATRALAAGSDRIYLGVTNRYVGDASATQWDPGGFYPQVRSLAFDLLGDDDRVRLGADLSAITSLGMTDPSARIHLNDIGTWYGGALWYSSVTASGEA